MRTYFASLLAVLLIVVGVFGQDGKSTFNVCHFILIFTVDNNYQ